MDYPRFEPAYMSESSATKLFTLHDSRWHAPPATYLKRGHCSHFVAYSKPETVSILESGALRDVCRPYLATLTRVEGLPPQVSPAKKMQKVGFELTHHGLGHFCPPCHSTGQCQCCVCCSKHEPANMVDAISSPGSSLRTSLQDLISPACFTYHSTSQWSCFADWSGLEPLNSSWVNAIDYSLQAHQIWLGCHRAV